MKILLLAFNVQEDIFPYGLSYLKGYAQRFHPETDIRIKEFSFGNRFGYDINKNIEQQAISYILIQKPDLVCFSCYIWSIEMVVKISRAIKIINPEIKIILGGVEVTENHLQESHCDYITTGEGEIALKELIDYYKGKIKLSEVHNISYLEKDQNVQNKIVQNELTKLELDTLPFPYKVLPEKKNFEAVRIETSRGCPFGCHYCYYAKHKEMRYFSLDYLKENITYLFDNYTFKNLTFLDANFNLNKERMAAILQIVADNVNKTKKKTRINLELKPELIDQEVIAILQKQPFKTFAELGLQSTDPDVLEKSSRPYNLEKVKNGLELLNTSSVLYKIDLMAGLPGDNFYKFLNSARFLLNNAKKQSILPVHHYMQLNKTTFCQNKEIYRYEKNNSSMIIKTDTQDLLDFYKIKLFVAMLNEELKIENR